MLSETYKEKLTKGENHLLLAEKIKASKASIGLIRIIGNFTVEGTLTDDTGQVTPITLTFIDEIIKSSSNGGFLLEIGSETTFMVFFRY